MFLLLLLKLSLMTTLVISSNHGPPLYACDHHQGGSCYFILDRARNQSDAGRLCSETEGGHLASIKDASNMEYIKYLLTSTHTEVAWIGAFYSGSSDSRGDVDCGVMSVSESGSARWGKKKCSDDGKYTCIYLRETLTRPCRYEFLTCGQYCIRRNNQVFGHPPELDWFNAKKICMEFGANLPPINSLNDAQTWVNTSCYNSIVSNRRRSAFETWTAYTNVQWKWNTNEPLEYTAWHPSFPMPELGKCVKITKGSMGTFLWKNAPCATRIPAICQIPYPPYARTVPSSVENSESREEPRIRRVKTTTATRKRNTWSKPTRRYRTSSTSPLITQNEMTTHPDGGLDRDVKNGDEENRRPKPPTRPEKSPVPVLYIGLAAGACALLIILIIIVICCWLRKSKRCSNSSEPKTSEATPIGRGMSRTDNPGYDTIAEDEVKKSYSQGNIYEGLENAAFDGMSRHEYEMLTESRQSRSGGPGQSRAQPHSPVSPPPSHLHAKVKSTKNKTPLPKIDPIRRIMRLPSLPHARGSNIARPSSLDHQTYIDREPDPVTPRSIDYQWQYLEVIAPPEEREGRRLATKGSSDIQGSGINITDNGVQQSKRKP